jgi:hypothetical protein
MLLLAHRFVAETVFLQRDDETKQNTKDSYTWKSWLYSQHFSTDDGHELRNSSGVLDGFNRVLGREFPHHQCQLTIECHLDRRSINSLDVFWGVGAASLARLLRTCCQITLSVGKRLQFFKQSHMTAVIPLHQDIVFVRLLNSAQFPRRLPEVA